MFPLTHVRRCPSSWKILPPLVVSWFHQWQFNDNLCPLVSRIEIQFRKICSKHTVFQPVLSWSNQTESNLAHFYMLWTPRYFATFVGYSEHSIRITQTYSELLIVENSRQQLCVTSYSENRSCWWTSTVMCQEMTSFRARSFMDVIDI